MMKICLIFMVFLDLAAGKYQILKLKRSPESASIEDIGCALERYDADFTRGVAIDAQTKTCDSLPESWFSNQTLEENQVYFSLYLTENVFEPTKAMTWSLPADISLGSTIAGYIKTGQVSSTGEFKLDIESEDSTIKCLHMNVRFWQYRVVFNSFRGGWGYEIVKSNPFTESNRTYKIEYRITEYAIEMFVDEVLFYSYQHRIPISDCNKVMYESQVVDCHRLQYFYPD